MNTLKTLSLIAIVAALLLVPALSFGAGELAAGKEALQAGEIDKAIGLLDLAITSGSLQKNDRAEAYFHRGQAFEAKEYWADAERDYGWALALSGYNAAYLKAFRKARRRNSPGPP